METWIILIIITLVLSFLFSGIEIAFISSNKLKIELDRKNNHLSGKILSFFINHPSDFVSTILVGNNISLVLYSMAMAALLEPWMMRNFPSPLQSSFFVMVTQTVVSTLIILILAEFLPKTLFRINPNRLITFFAVPLKFLYYLLLPLQFVFVKCSELVLKYIFRVNLVHTTYRFGSIDLNNFLNAYEPDETHEENISSEIQMIQNAIDFRNLRVRECMIPRNEITALEINDSMEELKKAFIETGHSKILIYRDTIDQIIGYVHSFDLFKNPKSIKSILMRILIVPETLAARELLRMFIQSRKHAAVVVDEFGGTSGMLTLEDILEEIVGEINDEFDKVAHFEKVISDHEYVFSARLEIDYLNDKYKLDLPDDESYTTLAGLIIHYHESIPAVGDSVKVGKFTFNIKEAGSTRIEVVQLTITENE
jgi:CBS domain containing-hemolysin-like protein